MIESPPAPACPIPLLVRLYVTQHVLRWWVWNGTRRGAQAPRISRGKGWQGATGRWGWGRRVRYRGSNTIQRWGRWQGKQGGEGGGGGGHQLLCGVHGQRSAAVLCLVGGGMGTDGKVGRGGSGVSPRQCPQYRRERIKGCGVVGIGGCIRRERGVRSNRARHMGGVAGGGRWLSRGGWAWGRTEGSAAATSGVPGLLPPAPRRRVS